MNAKDLKGRAVVALSGAEKIGVVDDVLLDAQLRQVVGFRVKKSTFGRTEALRRADVSAVGGDALTVASADALNAEDRLVGLGGAVPLSQATGMKIVSEGGHLLGTVTNVELDDAARVVTSYVLDAPLVERLRHREPRLEASAVLQIGAGGLMIVPETVAESLQAEQ